MFEFLLIGSLVVVVVAAFLFLRPAKSDALSITTKLESLNKALYFEREGNEILCTIKHVTGDNDRLLVFLTSQTDQNLNSLGSIPYEYKGRILHFTNTKSLGCRATFNKTSEELTIELLEDLE